jgi:hypothetical protein
MSTQLHCEITGLDRSSESALSPCLLPEAQASPMARHMGLAEPNPLPFGHAAPSAINHSRR